MTLLPFGLDLLFVAGHIRQPLRARRYAIAFAEFVPNCAPGQRARVFHQGETLVAAPGILGLLKLRRGVQQPAEDRLARGAGPDDVSRHPIDRRIEEIERGR